MELTTLTKKTLVLKYEIYKEDGEEAVFTTQKFSNLKTSASDEVLKEVGSKLAVLINSNSIFVRKEENYIFN